MDEKRARPRLGYDYVIMLDCGVGLMRGLGRSI